MAVTRPSCGHRPSGFGFWRSYPCGDDRLVLPVSLSPGSLFRVPLGLHTAARAAQTPRGALCPSGGRPSCPLTEPMRFRLWVRGHDSCQACRPLALVSSVMNKPWCWGCGSRPCNDPVPCRTSNFFIYFQHGLGDSYLTLGAVICCYRRLFSRASFSWFGQ